MMTQEGIAVLAAALLAAPAPPTPDADTVTIHRDEWGVPHVYGPTDASVVFGAAYAQAQDNWGQVRENFLRALGRGAEILGEEAVVDDYLARALEIPRRSIEEYERAPPEMRALYDAYAAGFNDWLATDRRARARESPLEQQARDREVFEPAGPTRPASSE